MPGPLPAHVRRVVELLAAAPTGFTRDELITAVQATIRNVPAARVRQLVASAVAAGAVRERAGRLYAQGADPVPAADRGEEPAGRLRPMRAAIVDVESVVRTTAEEPYTEKRIYQIGAARVGADSDWVEQEPVFRVWVELPDDEWVIRSETVRVQHAAGAVEPAEALTALAEYLRNADTLVAYNGLDADFPLLADACHREGLPPLGGTYVDAYYLTLAIWPTAPSHRLAHIAAAAGVITADLRWHDAADDCVLLARVLTRAAQVLAGWSADLVDLIASVAPDSAGWQLLRELSGGGVPVGTARPHRHAEVAAIVHAELAGHAPRRAAAGAPPLGRVALRVPGHLRGPDGRVSATELARAVHGPNASPRAAQVQMTDTLHDWAAAGVGGLLEAPTGTGKSLAVLAAALEWLAGGPDRCAIVSTFTKQLQAQLAHDVATLAGAVPGVLDATDVVKGSGNRLSLRGLIAVLAEATSTMAGGRRQETRFVQRPVFRELLLFLMLRLLAATERLDVWAARSVDPVDVPVFFGAYSGGALPVWLDSLSQAANGEYGARSAPVAAHTDEVTEALASHRLVLANHALLMAHTDALADLGPDTLLVVDEAHQLEDAATGALTAELDYRAVEDLLGDLRAWVGEHRRVAEVAAVDTAVGNLALLLEHENLPRAASQAFDARSSGVGTVIGSRTVTLASPYAGIAGVPQVRALNSLLTRLSGVCAAVVGSLGTFAAAHRTALDFFEAERLAALTIRTAAISNVAAEIVTDAIAILGPARPENGAGHRAAAGVGNNGRPAATADAATTGAGTNDAGTAGAISSDSHPDTETTDADSDADDAGTDDSDADDAGTDGNGVTVQAPEGPPPPMPNQVVYATETDPLRKGLRYYRFTLSSSPIDLPADTRWLDFTATFARTCYVSATLRVAGGWDYIRGRLGLPSTVRELALDTPFDMASQAELVCFSDFPSWAEQSDGAMRTVAHQLARYTSELIHPVPGTDQGIPAQAGDRGGYDNGAMVLTTARSTAGGISDHLAQELRRTGSDVPLHSATVLGNPRAVASFTDHEAGGGLLVGTRGLWQGVDIADEHRLRMVWINKLPFAPFADPVVEARRASVTARAEATGADDPDQVATETYYLPLAALGMRQAVGRMIRSERHRGVIVISDRKLAGLTALRRSYRTVFLGSLDPGLLRADPDTGEPTGGNVMSMADGWERIWRFYARHGLISADRADALCTPEALAEHSLLPQTRRIRQLALTADEVAAHRTAGTLADEVAARCAQVGGLLHLSDDPATLKDSQVEVIRAVAEGRNVLGLLPTGFGKSFCFQLPALVLPGVTLVVSPLVALMHDQALELNRSIGGAVRALVAPLRESSSRAGKTEVADQLQGRADHGIRLVYVSPERLCQRRFRELVRDAVAAGRISRIVLDEAHTFVQWGDDFRPSFRRVEQFLTQLRNDYELPVTALTATANRTVHAGLREGVFALPGDPPPGGDGAALVTVTENPIRPELAVFRRSLNQAGPSIVAGLAEEVLDKIDDHAIFYCLTVKETNALHAHLREYLGEAGVRVRRFHGRLTEAEKAAVMNEFREAPRKGAEGFAPLVVVATSAFGLGINRPDVRTVFCVSPPTDLAALYQQIGRAGRDAAGRALVGAVDTSEEGTDTATDDPTTPARDAAARDSTTEPVDTAAVGETSSPAVAAGASEGVPNVGLTLMTTRSLRTAAWMSGQDLPTPLLVRMGRAVLACRDTLDAEAIADTLIGQDLASGALTADKARSRFTHESYRTGVVRAFAALATLGGVTDLGDFPPWAAIKPGELLTQPAASADAATSAGRVDSGATPDADVDVEGAIEGAVVAALLALPVRGNGPLTRSRLNVAAADRHLAATLPGYRDLTDDSAGTWQLLADLHDRGLLDVSAAPSRTLITGVTVHTRDLPDGYAAALSGKAARAAAEVAALQSFFADTHICANEKFADYFGVAVPAGCCTTETNRCSACWDYRDDWPATDRRPATADALDTPRPRPAGWRTDAATKARRLDEQIRKLCWLHDRGLSTNELRLALRGLDSWFYARARRMIRLPSMVVNSRYFGANPAVALDEIDAACQRLAADGQLVAEGRRWRDRGNVARQAARQARQAAAATGNTTSGNAAGRGSA